MSKQRVVRDEIWDDEWFFDLDPESKLVWFFLLTNTRCNIAGVYKLNTKWAARTIGMEPEQIEKILYEFVEKGKLHREREWIILINFTKHQAMNPSVVAGIQRVINDLPDDLQEYMSKIVRFDNIVYKNVGTTKKRRVVAKSGSKCKKCGSNERLEVDHIVPIHAGGTTDEDNLQVLCHDCHREKTKLDGQTVTDSHTLLNSTLLNSNESSDDKSSKRSPKKEKRKYGEMKNVLLTDEEKQKLIDKYGRSAAKDYVDKLSLYISSKSKRYKSHYATILAWMRRDGVVVEKKPVQPPIEPEKPLSKEDQERLAQKRAEITKSLTMKKK